MSSQHDRRVPRAQRRVTLPKARPATYRQEKFLASAYDPEAHSQCQGGVALHFTFNGRQGSYYELSRQEALAVAEVLLAGAGQSKLAHSVSLAERALARAQDKAATRLSGAEKAPHPVPTKRERSRREAK